MEKEEFLRQVCPVVKTLEHYNGLAGYLKSRKMGPDFFVHGDMEVVKEVIAGIDYDTQRLYQWWRSRSCTSLGFQRGRA